MSEVKLLGHFMSQVVLIVPQHQFDEDGFILVQTVHLLVSETPASSTTIPLQGILYPQVPTNITQHICVDHLIPQESLTITRSLQQLTLVLLLNLKLTRLDAIQHTLRQLVLLGSQFIILDGAPLLE